MTFPTTRLGRLRIAVTAALLGRLGTRAAHALLALAVAACGATVDPPPAVDRPSVGSVETVPAPPAPSGDERTGADGTDLDDPAAGQPALVGRAVADLEVFEAPRDRDPARVLPPTTDFGTTTVVLVVDDAPGDDDGWLEVLLPGRPTGAVGWVRAADVELREVDVEVTVDLVARQLTVHRGDEVLLATEVTIGTDQYPTPTGRFFVTDKLDTQDEDGPYGPYALGLSARSEVLTEFAGGDGQIGIHGTNDPGTLGQPASHGCVRVPNDVVRQLVSLLPLGTPVVVS